jgi:hypothetical protein
MYNSNNLTILYNYVNDTQQNVATKSSHLAVSLMVVANETWEVEI